MFSANRYERPKEFAKRAGAELLPEQLKQKGIISEDNDESYELELYEMEWPEGYRNVNEAVQSMVQALADEVPGEVTNTDDLEACIRATERLAPIFYLELQLRTWQPSDKNVLSEIIERFRKVRLAPANPKYFLLFVVAKYYNDSERMVEPDHRGFFQRLMRPRIDIDEILANLVEEGAPYGLLAPLEKIERHHVDVWFNKTRKTIDIPEEYEEDIINKMHQPFLEHDSDKEHYQVVAPCMRDALKAVFLAKNG